MNSVRDLTLGALVERLGKYRPFALVMVGILLLAFVSPGSRDTARDGTGGLPAGQAIGAAASTGGQQTAADAPPGSALRAGQPAGGADAGASIAAAAPSAATGTAAATGAQAASPASRTASEPQPVSADAQSAPDCDPATGRIRFPSVYAPPCVPEWPAGQKAGATSQGVHDDKIIIAVRFSDPTPEGQAIAAAIGNDDTQEDVQETRQAYVDLFQSHYQTYGREVELVYFKASGTDEQAARADALKVATEIKAFAALGGPPTYRDELAARGILCFACAVSQSIEIYLNNAPYVWDLLMANTQGFVHRMEYAGKRLCGRQAKWAGSPLFQAQERNIGLVSIDTVDHQYQAGVEFGVRELEQKYGCRLGDLIYYLPDLATAQEQSRTIIARLKDRGITTVMFAGDPIAPIFFTQEATRQQYQPEWIITGSALTDTTFFARTYDQTQWRHAFGISYLAARVPFEVQEGWRLHLWHHDAPPRAEDTWSIIWPYVEMIFLGIHMAGPNLTPETFRDGMFAFPPSGGGIVNIHKSFGQHGLWPWDDYLAYDDATEIWWDATARGTDENGNEGIGMYRYVLGGKRYIPGAWPASEPTAFDEAGTVMMYDDLPPGDEYPEYEHRHYR